MWDFLKKIKIGMMGSSIITLILGLILLLNPIGAIETVCSLIGFFILILGIFGLLNHFVLDTESSSTLVLGVSMIGVLLGIYILANPGSIVKFFSIVVAVILLLHGLRDVDTAMQMKRGGYEKWWGSLVIAIITILLGAFVFRNPFAAPELVSRVIGACFLFNGATDLLIVRRASKVLKDVREKSEPIDVDAKIR